MYNNTINIYKECKWGQFSLHVIVIIRPLDKRWHCEFAMRKLHASRSELINSSTDRDSVFVPGDDRYRCACDITHQVGRLIHHYRDIRQQAIVSNIRWDCIEGKEETEKRKIVKCAESETSLRNF